MKKITKIILIVTISVIVIGSGIGIGIYFWLNPLGSANETLAPGTTIAEGTFVELDSSHWGTGTVRLVKLADESHQIQFDNVEIANGPDLYVYLSNKSSFTGLYDDNGEIIDLGLLPYNKGRFSVDIPTSESVLNVNSVLIWCLQFNVIFTYAQLQ